MTCMAIVAAFLVLEAGCGTRRHRRRLGSEVGVPDAPPSFVGPRPAEDVGAIIEPSKARAVDLSDIDPGRRAMPSGLLRRLFKTEDAVRQPTLPYGGDRLPRRWARSSRAPRSRWWWPGRRRGGHL